uniref:small monomeric GTPase n=1 Tax=Pan troglodytes TaxID=9598 RepID=A0A2I3TR16_PANTR
MSRKKTPKSKGASTPAASTLPTANGARPARSGTALSGPDAPPNGPLQPGRPSLGGGVDFYDVAFKVTGRTGSTGLGVHCPGPWGQAAWFCLFQNKVLDVDGVKVKLQMWDTAGQERFRSVTHAYYRDAHALLLLYDVTNKASFDNIQAWLTEIHEYAQHDVALMLLGNKVDSAHERVVKREDGEKLAKEYGLPFMETSAKTGLNVDLAFTAIAKELKQRSMKAPSEPRFRLHDYVKREGRGASCCRP